MVSSPTLPDDVLLHAQELLKTAKCMREKGDLVDAHSYCRLAISCLKVVRSGECTEPFRTLYAECLDEGAAVCFELEWFSDSAKLYGKMVDWLKKDGIAANYQYATACLQLATALLQGLQDYTYVDQSEADAQQALALMQEGVAIFDKVLHQKRGPLRKFLIGHLRRAVGASSACSAVDLARALAHGRYSPNRIGELKPFADGSVCNAWLKAAAQVQKLLYVTGKRSAACVAESDAAAAAAAAAGGGGGGGGGSKEDAGAPKRPSL